MSDHPVYTIRIAAQLVGVHQQTLRTYEREGLLVPARSAGRQRLYSQADIERLLIIRRLIDELGVNLAGADIILRLRQQLDELQEENRQLKRELQQLRDQQPPAVQSRQARQKPAASRPPAPQNIPPTQPTTRHHLERRR